MYNNIDLEIEYDKEKSVDMYLLNITSFKLLSFKYRITKAPSISLFDIEKHNDILQTKKVKLKKVLIVVNFENGIYKANYDVDDSIKSINLSLNKTRGEIKQIKVKFTFDE